MKNGGGKQIKTCWKGNSDGSREETKLEVSENHCITKVQEITFPTCMQLTDLEDGSCEATIAERRCDRFGNCSNFNDGKKLNKTTGPCSSFKTFLRCPY